jgi:multisubunit Na+/H+ antiporter MnhB subunit
MAVRWMLLVALVLSGLLTWLEWVEHRPPDIALVALVHFVVVLAAVAIVTYLVRRLRRRASR